MRAAEFTHIYQVHTAAHTDFYLESLQITPGFIETHGLKCGFCFMSKLVTVQNGLGSLWAQTSPSLWNKSASFLLQQRRNTSTLSLTQAP